MNECVMINSCEIILEIFFDKNYCEIQMCNILVWALYWIKYSMLLHSSARQLGWYCNKLLVAIELLLFG
jgi:hypothetical protein